MMKENEIIKNMMSRVSVRQFTQESVDNEDLQLLLRCGMAAPSSMGLYPWHFVVLDNEDVKDELRKALPYAKMLTEGTVGIVICGDTSVYDRINSIGCEDNTLYWVQDCSAVSENILLAAHALGLGAVWTGIFPLESRIDLLRQMFDIPQRMVPLNLIVVGHPAKEPAAKDKWNVTRIHHNRF